MNTTVAHNEDVRQAYPNRYYAYYDTKATQPTQIVGWIDAWVIQNASNLPPASELLPLTEDQWNTAPRQGSGVSNGALVSYTPPATTAKS